METIGQSFVVIAALGVLVFVLFVLFKRSYAGEREATVATLILLLFIIVLSVLLAHRSMLPLIIAPVILGVTLWAAKISQRKQTPACR